MESSLRGQYESETGAHTSHSTTVQHAPEPRASEFVSQQESFFANASLT
jgi:hypothetical protein